MPLLLHSGNALSVDWLSALAANCSLLGVIVLLAVGLSLELKEFAVSKMFGAHCAVEVVLVPILAKSLDGSAVANRSVALAARIAEQLIVVFQAVSVLVLFVELAILKNSVANSAVKAAKKEGDISYKEHTNLALSYLS